jgi:hypothetical protein
MGTNGAVLVVTTDPLRNPNYGGILQAWALCEALQKLGYEPWIYDKHSTKPWRAWYSIVRLGCRFAPRRLTLRWWHCWPENQPILQFARNNLRYTSSTTSAPRTPDNAVSAPFVAYVTGSDQVWRPEIYDVAQNLLDFVPDSFMGPRIAYAASFGKDDPSMFSEKACAQTKPLAQKLTAVSVREVSGISMAKHLWGVAAQRVTDPVFLIGTDEYRDLFSIPEEQPNLVTYILDPNEEAERVISELLSKADELGIENVVHLTPRGKNGEKPVVEEWIRAIGSAKYVLTDSFHGTAFSILFDRPFITLVNQSRGASRFDSLFAVYEQCPMRNSPVDKLQQSVTAGETQRQIVQIERESGMSYLSEALNGTG